ncbi:putative hydro-lyase [Bradyrhizobium tropiciagri]|uniref:putative hydro-lyase n=1 Tax=Bradyrhizobium tropiciagri TaxID=312253 RepID=UPI001BAB4A2B|nr:putative hydro-lyase [Bradyrhizobium tropiciagri]MBR0900147.1 putative hydro-lyase [Bradyrhizobium tropiciagri]
MNGRLPDFDISNAASIRRAVRIGGYAGYTAGFARERVQANICILPRSHAEDFLLYCQRNPQPCPLLARSDVGDPYLPSLGTDIDIRTDVPRYHVFRDGEFVEEVADISHLWRDDLVSFALGCSFSFEYALADAGVPLRYLDRGDVAGVYETTLDTKPAGDFRAKLVVTMRPFAARDAIRAIQITSRFPNVHGAPVHIGDPGLIGVDLSKRYRGVGSGEVLANEVPLFWACGLTPQLAVANAKPPLCITHAPSSMLVTDLRNASLASF